MGGFTKLHASIIHSSVWGAPLPERVVWITMMAMADENGLVSASVGGLAKAAGVTRKECLAALESFLSPDPDSRTKEQDGRRIEEVSGGWVLINHAQYRDRRTDAQVQAAERSRRYRERRRERMARDASRKKGPASRDVTPVTRYPLEAEAEEEEEAEEENVVVSEVQARNGRRPAPKSKPLKRGPDLSAEAIQVSQYLFDAIRSHRPEFKAGVSPVKLESMLMGWAKAVDVGMRNDGMTLDGCQRAIDVAHKSRDGFWRANLLSGAKLRKHYEALLMKAPEAKAKPGGLPEGFDFSEFGKRMGLGNE